MSNRVNIILTKFADISGEESFGYRIFDNYERDYDDFMDRYVFEYYSQPENVAEFVKCVVNNASVNSRSLIGFMKDNGASVNDVWYDAEEIKQMITE